MRRALLSFLLVTAAAADESEVRADRRMAAGRHRLEAPLRVVANDVVLDLTGAVLEGDDEAAAPDSYQGIGILVEGCKRVTIRGGRLRGFRCAILVRDCEEVVIEGVECSDNFRQRLGSTPEREDPADWLRPHDNDRQEWRTRYGSGICLENCRRCEVRGCRARRQQNGLILDRCEGCSVYDNDFSFLSGWGVALWRSSDNRVGHNKLDWCVRGYSHGVYARGQDSAGILVFEQSNGNVFYKNSATHGGDGFFLYAGNETLHRTGTGGCNSNVVLNNDFSHAVANAIEATFSHGNVFRGNLCNDSRFGIWAGYSYECIFEGNHLSANTEAGIAIEHGARHRIFFNTFTDNPTGIRLWWDDDKELLATRFAKEQACRSIDYEIGMNSFVGHKTAIALVETTRVALQENSFEGDGERVSRRGDCAGLREATDLDPLGLKVDYRYVGEQQAFLPEDHPRGRDRIRIDEWGPLDPKEAAVFPRDVVSWDRCTFFVLGGGAYEVEGLPDGFVVEREPHRFRVTREGSGLFPFTATVRAGERRFPVSGTLLRAAWTVRFWKWEQDPREEGAYARLVKSEPLATRELTELDFRWNAGGPGGGVPPDGFATRSEATLDLPAGRYEVRTVSDDGVRVLIDGRKVQEDWTHHGPTEHRTIVELAAGRHSFVVEHFELDGYAVLAFFLRPVR